jgi:hypothetical protein
MRVESRPSATADGTESLLIAEQVIVNGTMRVESRPSATAHGTESLIRRLVNLCGGSRELSPRALLNRCCGLCEFVPWIARVESRPSATAHGTELLIRRLTQFVRWIARVESPRATESLMWLT